MFFLVARLNAAMMQPQIAVKVITRVYYSRAAMDPWEKIVTSQRKNENVTSTKRNSCKKNHVVATSEQVTEIVS